MGGVETLYKLPNAIFITDIKKEVIAVKEAKKLNIPIIAVTDTNTDPSLIDFPIPANDDAMKSLEYIITKVGEHYLKGKQSPKIT